MFFDALLEFRKKRVVRFFLPHARHWTMPGADHRVILEGEQLRPVRRQSVLIGYHSPTHGLGEKRITDDRHRALKPLNDISDTSRGMPLGKPRGNSKRSK